MDSMVKLDQKVEKILEDLVLGLAREMVRLYYEVMNLPAVNLMLVDSMLV